MWARWMTQGWAVYRYGDLICMACTRQPGFQERAGEMLLMMPG